MPRLNPPSQPAPETHPSSILPHFSLSGSPVFCLILIIGVAFALRVIKLNNLPLSLSLDEATNGLDALQLIQLGRLTPFLQNNFGRETLFFYGQGLALKFYGLSFFSLRFVSVLLGTLTVPLLYRTGVALQLDALLSKKAGFSPASVTGLLAATGLAVSYWHIYFSRLGLRAILLPPLLLGLVWCFWRGWYRPTAGRATLPTWSGHLWLVMAGFLLGLSLYTYLAARLLPLLLTIFAAIDLLSRDRSNRRQRVAGFLLFSFTAWLTAIPLLLYFQQNPQAIGSRTQTLWIFATANPLQSFLANLSALAQIHFATGTWLQTWPALNFISALGFLLGLAICLYRLKEPAALFLLLWWGAGMAPVLLSVQDWSGQTTLLRGIVAWPALFLISAVGLAGLAGALHRGLRQASYRSLAGYFIHSAAMFWLLLLVGGGTTVYHYFGIWANRFNNFSDHPAYMARYLNRQTRQLTLTPMMFYAENVVHFLLQARYPTLTNLKAGRLHALLSSNRPAVYLLPPKSTAEATFVLLAPAADGRGTAYLLPPLTPAQLQALSDYTAKTAPLTPVLDSEQELIARVYPLWPFLPFLAPGDSAQKPTTASRAVGANFNEIIQLTGYQLEPATLKPGQTATLTLNWQALQPVDGDYNLFIHLFHIAQNRRYGQVNANLSGILFDAHRWPAGLTVPDPHDFTLPPDAPEGVYRFEVGLYQAASRQRLPVAGEAAPPDQSTGDSLILGKLRVQRQPPAPAQLPLANYQFGDSIALIGLDFDAGKSLQPGQHLTYTLYWQAVAPITKNYTVFNHLLDSQGNLKAQQDNIPMQGRYPTFWWDAGEVVPDAYDLPLPPDLAPGRYTLRVGLYQPETGRRLPLKNSGQDFVDLPASITIQN